MLAVLLIAGLPARVAAQEAVPCGSEPTSMSMAYGDSITCSLEIAGDSDTFRFAANAGDMIVVQATWRSGSLRPCVELIAPDNSRIRQCTLNFANRIDAVLTMSGTFTVVTTDWFGTSTGNYTVALERVMPPSPTARSITYGQTLPDDINVGGDLDLFAFNGVAGQVIAITAAWRNGSLRPCVELVRPDRVRTNVCSLNFTNRIDATLTANGPHTILIRDWFSTSFGGYSVTVQCFIGCTDPPPPPLGPPSNLEATVTGSTVQLSWSAPTSGTPVSYILEAGTASGASNIATVDTGSTVTSLTALSVPTGTYFVRVKARNASGTSSASNEVSFTVGTGPCTSAPGPPIGLSAAVSGRVVTLRWSAPAGGATSYVLEAGTAAGSSNITVFATLDARTTLVATAPPGVYYVRLRARNSCGTSPTSNEVVITVQ